MATHPPLSPAPGFREAVFWLLIYFALNLSLTIYNKVVMQFFHFPFPWTLTAVHTACGTIGCYLCSGTGFFVPAKLGQREKLVVVLFSILYTLNIAVSNVSLNMVTVPFHQVVRSTVPLFTILISIIFLKKSYSGAIYLTLLPTILGVCLATAGDYYFTSIGSILTLLGTVLAALKTIVTNRVQVGSLKLHPLDLLMRMSPLALLQTMMYSFVTGEMSRTFDFYSQGGMTPALMVALFFNGAIAFALNFASLTANKKTNALTMGVAGNVKQVLSIILSVTIFNLEITSMNALGILMTLFGGAWYTYTDYQLKQKKDASKETGSTAMLLEEGNRRAS
ncbi:hypothetical protein SpCBS45565_g03109 [Spizellomyces sp. 'palustris']|nr:hypothetical protein SpCBS45565_g03109 [Spizellomyces sp. 'palustris']